MLASETVHLEVGLDTFRVVETEDPHEHHMHTEYYSVPQKTVDAIKRTKENGGRVIAVGTTSVRSLEVPGITKRASWSHVNAKPPTCLSSLAIPSMWLMRSLRIFTFRARRS